MKVKPGFNLVVGLVTKHGCQNEKPKGQNSALDNTTLRKLPLAHCMQVAPHLRRRQVKRSDLQLVGGGTSFAKTGLHVPRQKRACVLSETCFGVCQRKTGCKITGPLKKTKPLVCGSPVLQRVGSESIQAAHVAEGHPVGHLTALAQVVVRIAVDVVVGA